jgi:hypothetical protein
MLDGWLFWAVMAFVIWRLAASCGCWDWLERRRLRGRSGSADVAGAGISREVADQRSYIDALETRVAELEERLDFTERLLAGRG